MDQLNAGQASDAANGAFKGMVNAKLTGLIGYSLGGYGAVNTVGGGFSAAAVKLPMAPANEALARRAAGNADYVATMDARIKAVIAIAPWGWNTGFWDATGLAGIRTPIFYVAGSVDDVSGYAPGRAQPVRKQRQRAALAADLRERQPQRGRTRCRHPRRAGPGCRTCRPHRRRTTWTRYGTACA